MLTPDEAVEAPTFPSLAVLCGLATLGVVNEPEDPTVPFPRPGLDWTEQTTILSSFGDLAVNPGPEDTRHTNHVVETVAATRARLHVTGGDRTRPSVEVMSRILSGLRRL